MELACPLATLPKERKKSFDLLLTEFIKTYKTERPLFFVVDSWMAVEKLYVFINNYK
jgi:hypothetical protein